MKKLLCIALLCIYLTLSISTASFALDIEKLDLKLEIPAQMITFSKDIPTEAANLSLINLDKEALKKMMKQDNSYLQAFSLDNSYKIKLITKRTEFSDRIFNFNILDDATLTTTVKEVFRQESEANPNYYYRENYATIYEHPQIKFISYNVTQHHDTDQNGQHHHYHEYEKQYYTIINGRTIIISAQSTKPLMEPMYQTLKTIVDSIEFTTIRNKPGIIIQLINKVIFNPLIGLIPLLIILLLIEFKSKKAKH